MIKRTRSNPAANAAITMLVATAVALAIMAAIVSASERARADTGGTPVQRCVPAVLCSGPV